MKSINLRGKINQWGESLEASLNPPPAPRPNPMRRSDKDRRVMAYKSITFLLVKHAKKEFLYYHPEDRSFEWSLKDDIPGVRVTMNLLFYRFYLELERALKAQGLEITENILRDITETHIWAVEYMPGKYQIEAEPVFP